MFLDASRVFVGHTCPEAVPDTLDALPRVLSDNERHRAARFRFREDRACYVAGRATLRMLLGHGLMHPPERLRFGEGAYGKPYLSEPAHTGLHFNLSHSYGLVAVAVAHGRPVGIDVECVRPLDDMEVLARRFFSAREHAMWQSLPPDEQRPAFFRCWTRKEAYVKARGEGLSFPLDSFDVSLHPSEPAALLATRIAPEDAARWTLSALSLREGYQAALAVEGVPTYTVRSLYPARVEHQRTRRRTCL